MRSAVNARPGDLASGGQGKRDGCATPVRRVPLVIGRRRADHGAAAALEAERYLAARRAVESKPVTAPIPV